MKRGIAQWLIACAALALEFPAAAAEEFRFGIVAPPLSDSPESEGNLRKALAETGNENLAFVVVTGIKAAAEPCSDTLFEQRQSLFDNAKHGVIVSIAASDWNDCRYSNGRTAAVERLNRIRELFFTGEFSLGASKVPLMRQSTNVKFRDYSENLRWEIGGIMFATLHLPSNNNRYLAAAGRNAEFEDRLVANRDWLHRVVTHAKHNKSLGIVILSDGDPLAEPARRRVRRDGFSEVRRQLKTLAAKFTGKILLVHNQSPSAESAQTGIAWDRNLGRLGIASSWLKLAVTPSQPALFAVDEERSDSAK